MWAGLSFPGCSFMSTFLHVGCGPKRKDRTTRGFNTDEWSEKRLDIDPSVEPDIIGITPDMAAGNLYMAHRCGFTQKVLRGTLQATGFAHVATMSRGAPAFDLWALASKSERSEDDMRALAQLHFG